MSLVATDACLDCGVPGHSISHAGKVVRLDCETHPKGSYACLNSDFYRVVKHGEPSSIYTIKEEYTNLLRRYRSHDETCTSSLRPEAPSETAKTRDVRPRRRTMRGFGGSSDG